ncbi:MAG: hypothetical protein H0W74_02300 [Sphingosinicella sp.]|nr:hypothetical protein [Sphingosinicella sp.]
MNRFLMVTAALGVGTPLLAQDPATEPPARNDAPCSSPGAENCIQLPERPIGADSTFDGTMPSDGGSYERVTEANSLLTAHDELMEHPATVNEALGGPIEGRTGYPACDPGPGDDNCIQLYERGVTGQGN